MSNTPNIQLINGDCLNVLKTINRDKSIIVTDPPFNIGYHYKSYKDKLCEDEYLEMINNIIDDNPCVIIHYPEMLYKISSKISTPPTE